jgi:hypothetical protein
MEGWSMNPQTTPTESDVIGAALAWYRARREARVRWQVVECQDRASRSAIELERTIDRYLATKGASVDG